MADPAAGAALADGAQVPVLEMSPDERARFVIVSMEAGIKPERPRLIPADLHGLKRHRS